VFRRIGGLEITLIYYAQYSSVFRRIGGLEMNDVRLGVAASVFRRIGMLPVKRTVKNIKILWSTDSSVGQFSPIKV